MIRKLKSRSGETLTEVLAGILIAAVASSMVLSAVVVSQRLNLSAGDADEHFYRAMSDLEAFTDTSEEVTGPVTGSLQVTIHPPGAGAAVSETFPVNVYTGESMTAYRRQSASAGGDPGE